MKAVVVVVSDIHYFMPRAQRTIADIRTRGEWDGDLVHISLGFDMPDVFRKEFDVTEVHFPPIDLTPLFAVIGEGFDVGDGRERRLPLQWEKLHVFDDYFRKWDRVVFFDAGLRVLQPVSIALDLDSRGALLAYNDAGPNRTNPPWSSQVSFKYQAKEVLDGVIGDCGDRHDYMLNCMWVYDTAILDVCGKKELVEAMRMYPVAKNNEMTIMNIMFHFKHGLWKPFPWFHENRFFFEWSESKHPGTTWRDYCYVKYPYTIRLDEP